jgi:hypothetical protein
MDNADADLPALSEARLALAATRTPASASLLSSRALIVTSVAVVVALGLVWRAKKRGPVARAPRKTIAKRKR